MYQKWLGLLIHEYTYLNKRRISSLYPPLRGRKSAILEQRKHDVGSLINCLFFTKRKRTLTFPSGETKVGHFFSSLFEVPPKRDEQLYLGSPWSVLFTKNPKPRRTGKRDGQYLESLTFLWSKTRNNHDGGQEWRLDLQEPKETTLVLEGDPFHPPPTFSLTLLRVRSGTRVHSPCVSPITRRDCLPETRCRRRSRGVYVRPARVSRNGDYVNEEGLLSSRSDCCY